MIFSIAFYSTVSTEDSVYIIGGRIENLSAEQDDQYTATLAQFNSTQQWSIVGQLQQQRVGHASILIGDFAYIFGGSARDREGNPE